MLRGSQRLYCQSILRRTAVIRKLNAGEVEIRTLRVQELEVGGRRWP
jgi:hypothetical protein